MQFDYYALDHLSVDFFVFLSLKRLFYADNSESRELPKPRWTILRPNSFTRCRILQRWRPATAHEKFLQLG